VHNAFTFWEKYRLRSIDRMLSRPTVRCCCRCIINHYWMPYAARTVFLGGHPSRSKYKYHTLRVHSEWCAFRVYFVGNLISLPMRDLCKRLNIVHSVLRTMTAQKPQLLKLFCRKTDIFYTETRRTIASVTILNVPLCVELSQSVWPVRARKKKNSTRGRKVTRGVYFTHACSDPGEQFQPQTGQACSFHRRNQTCKVSSV